MHKYPPVWRQAPAAGILSDVHLAGHSVSPVFDRTMLLAVQDALFAVPRLARIYDVWEGQRIDLPHYLAIVAELGACSVLDVGCGTGN